jgi:flavin reductase (DIM6/NTAB) family NADH-FMN oxidoreductase RutF
MRGHACSSDAATEFGGVMGQFASGVAIVVAMMSGEPHATTVTALAPASFAPPLVAVFFATTSRMRARLERGARFSVSILAEQDHALARRFSRPGRPSGWEGLVGVPLTRADPAPPILREALAWMDCSVQQSVGVGDHTCFVGQVLAMGRRRDAAPLLYYRGRFLRRGPTLTPAPWRTPEPADLAAVW